MRPCDWQTKLETVVNSVHSVPTLRLEISDHYERLELICQSSEINRNAYGLIAPIVYRNKFGAGEEFIPLKYSTTRTLSDYAKYRLPDDSELMSLRCSSHFA